MPTIIVTIVGAAKENGIIVSDVPDCGVGCTDAGCVVCVGPATNEIGVCPVVVNLVMGGDLI